MIVFTTNGDSMTGKALIKNDFSQEEQYIDELHQRQIVGLPIKKQLTFNDIHGDRNVHKVLEWFFTPKIYDEWFELRLILDNTKEIIIHSDYFIDMQKKKEKENAEFKN